MNISQVKQDRMWAKWSRSGAVRLPDTKRVLAMIFTCPPERVYMAREALATANLPHMSAGWDERGQFCVYAEFGLLGRRYPTDSSAFWTALHAIYQRELMRRFGEFGAFDPFYKSAPRLSFRAIDRLNDLLAFTVQSRPKNKGRRKRLIGFDATGKFGRGE